MAVVENLLADVVSAISKRSVTILVTIGATVVSIYVTNRFVSSAREERHAQAKSDILDMLENEVINKKSISPQKMDNLVSAVERSNSVRFSDNISKISLLQDLLLRFEKSRHLEPDQKEEYSEIIDEQINELRDSEDESQTSLQYEDSIEEVKESIKQGDDERAIDTLEDIEDQLSSNDFVMVSSSSPPSMPIRLVLMAFLLITYYFIFTNILTEIPFSQLVPNNFISIVIAIMAVMAILYFGMLTIYKDI